MALGKHFPRVRFGTDLVAYYNLNVGFYTTGKVFDYSRKGHTGTVIGTSCLPKYPGFNFDGDKDYIDTNTTFQSVFRGSFSISLWIKPDDGLPAAPEHYIGSNNAADEDEVYFGTLGITGKITFSYKSNGNEGIARTGQVFVNDQETQHNIVAVADSTVGGAGGLKIYFDGVELPLVDPNDGDTSGVTFGDFTTSDNIFIGAQNIDGTPTDYFNGLIGEVMIYKKALTATEIKGLYRQTKRFYTKE